MTLKYEDGPDRIVQGLRRLSNLRVDNSLSLEPGLSVTWIDDGARGCLVELIEYCPDSDREIGRVSMYARRTAVIDIDDRSTFSDIYPVIDRASCAILELLT